MIITLGYVRDGKVEPNMPLPEGAFVRIEVLHDPIDVPPEVQEELDFWQRAGADAIELVERLAEEGEADAPR